MSSIYQSSTSQSSIKPYIYITHLTNQLSLSLSLSFYLYIYICIIYIYYIYIYIYINHQMKQMYSKSKSSTSHKALYNYIYTVYNFWLFPFPSFFPAFLLNHPGKAGLMEPGLRHATEGYELRQRLEGRLATPYGATLMQNLGRCCCLAGDDQKFGPHVVRDVVFLGEILGMGIYLM